MAAALAPGAVLAVDISGMTMFFEEGEVRCHEPIPPSRLRVLDPQPEPLPAMPGWKDPGFRHNHSDCLVRLGYPTLRRSVFREATARAELLNERGEYTFEQYRAIVRELAEH